MSDGDAEQFERAILDLLRARAAGVSICPSEAARRVAPDGWRERMDDVRSAAWRLARRGRVEVTRAGVVLRGPDDGRGPVRVRLTAPRPDGRPPG